MLFRAKASLPWYRISHFGVLTAGWGGGVDRLQCHSKFLQVLETSAVSDVLEWVEFDSR